LDEEKLTDDISVLVISDLKEALSEKALANVKDFVDRGGNMVILGEYERSENMNSLGALFGVHFSDGGLAHPNKLAITGHQHRIHLKILYLRIVQRNSSRYRHSISPSLHTIKS